MKSVLGTSFGGVGSMGVMLVAAAFEVGGDALIRAGLRGGGVALVLAGFAVLGSYGIVVNLLPMDFSKLLGAYVGFFAVVSIVAGRLVFKDQISRSTWLGLAVILVGSLIIQYGPRYPEARPTAQAGAPLDDPAQAVPPSSGR